jgi:enoyl-CoA hydratase
MTDGDITYGLDEHVAVLTIDRPERHNSLTLAMTRRLAEVTAEVRHDDRVRAIVLTGAGTRAFCAGGDLAELIPRLTAGDLEALFPDPTKRFFSDCYKPVVAAVNGLCIAGGLEILVGTDIRVAAEHAVFGLAETKWGIVPGGGSHVRLPQQIPWAIAMQILLTAEPIDARRAYEAGLVNEVLPGDAVLPRALEIAHGIARNGPLAVQAAKEIAVRALGNEARFALEQDVNRRVCGTADAKEGPRAFTERRTPVYEGR